MENGKLAAVFGVAMSVGAERMPSKDNSALPAVFCDCINHIETTAGALRFDGIYRITAFRSRVAALRDDYNRHQTPDLRLHDPHVAASLLKLYLRQLPNSLIPTKIHKAIQEAVTMHDVNKRQAMLKALLEQIPKTNRLAMGWLLVHLSHVLEHTNENNVTREQLVTVMCSPMQTTFAVLDGLLNDVHVLFSDIQLKNADADISDSGKRNQSLEFLSEGENAFLNLMGKNNKSNGETMKMAAGGENALGGTYLIDEEEDADDEKDFDMEAASERLRVYFEREYITEEQRKADPELRRAIFEEKALRIQQDELLDLHDQLRQKCCIEREEITSLRELLRKFRLKHCATGDGNVVDVEGGLLHSDDLQMEYIKLKEANSKMDEKIWNMVEEIHQHREACADIRVELRMCGNDNFVDIDPPSLTKTRALPDFDEMF